MIIPSLWLVLVLATEPSGPSGPYGSTAPSFVPPATSPGAPLVQAGPAGRAAQTGAQARRRANPRHANSGQANSGQANSPGRGAAPPESDPQYTGVPDAGGVRIMAAVRRILDEERGHDERLKEILALRREALRRGQEHRVESLEVWLERELRRHAEFMALGREELGEKDFEQAYEEAQRILEADKAELLARIQAAARARPATAPKGKGQAEPGGRRAGRGQPQQRPRGN